MAYILCVETATEICSVAIANDGKTIAIAEDKLGNNHASQLHILVQKVLDIASITLQDLNAIAVSKGPGSYTGLRVGVSSVKGYCYVLNIPLIAINTLQSLANGYLMQNPNYSGLICPMIDARRMEVYCAVFDSNLNEILPTQAKIIDEHSFANELAQNEIVFIGNGAAKCQSKFEYSSRLSGTKFEIGYVCNASFISSLAQAAFDKNEFEDVAYFEPYYLKDFVGTVAKKLV